MHVRKLIANELVFVRTLAIVVFMAPRLAAQAQTEVPQAQTASPRAPHVNAPLGDVSRMPGDGNGAYKTHGYRDLFAELGHSPAESCAKIEHAFQQLLHGERQNDGACF